MSHMRWSISVEIGEYSNKTQESEWAIPRVYMPLSRIFRNEYIPKFIQHSEIEYHSWCGGTRDQGIIAPRECGLYRKMGAGGPYRPAQTAMRLAVVEGSREKIAETGVKYCGICPHSPGQWCLPTVFTCYMRVMISMHTFDIPGILTERPHPALMMYAPPAPPRPPGMTTCHPLSKCSQRASRLF